MVDTSALRDALCLLEELHESDLMKVAEIISQWMSDDCRDLSVNLAHIIAMAADRIYI